MSTPPDAALGERVIRDAIDIRRFPWIRSLVVDQIEHYTSVSTLFAGNPTDPSAWRDTLDRVARAATTRDLIGDILDRQLASRGAPAAARDAATRLRHPSSVAILTGQQAGVFGGPLYTLLKAVTSIQLARHVTATYGTPAVPVFWVDAEDHDWEEVRSATVLDRDFDVKSLSLAPLDGAGAQPVGALRLNAAVSETIDALGATLQPTAFTGAVVEALHRRYTSGATLADACAGWMEDLLGAEGLVVFNASDPAAKPAVADIFARELKGGTPTSRLVREAGAAMSALGHPPQLDPPEDAVNLLYLDASGRRPFKRQGDGYLIGDVVRTAADLAAEAAKHPDRFSPNVVLRPLVQDRLFPTACYIAGPAELAYQAQLGGVYRAFGVEQPLIMSRGSATLIDSACGKFLDRHDVAFEALQAQGDAVLNRLLEQQLPPSIDRLLQESAAHFTAQAAALREVVTTIDPTLAGVVDTTETRIAETLKTLQSKIVQASKRKDETLRRQFARTRALAFPGGKPQERALNIAYFTNRYGLDLGTRLIDVLPLDTSRHYLVNL